MGLFTKKEAPQGETSQSKTDVEALLDAFSAKLEEHVKPLRETVTGLKTEWDAIKAEATKPPEKSADELTPEERDAREKAGLIQLNVETRAMMTEQRCLDSLSAEWASLKPELSQMFANTDWKTKALPTYPKMCQDAVTMLIGREAMKSGLRRDSNTGRFFIEDATANTGGEDSPLNQIPAWQSDDRVETVDETLRKMKVDPKLFAEDLRKGILQ